MVGGAVGFSTLRGEVIGKKWLAGAFGAESIS